MKTSLLFAFGLGWAATTIPAGLAAQDETPEDTITAAENFELSLFPPVQLRGEDSAIRILRLGLYNKNVSVKGLDIGVVNQTTGGISKGVQFGVVGFVEGDFSGWQSNIVNIVEGEFNGLQGPACSTTKSITGKPFKLAFSTGPATSVASSSVS